MPSLIGRFEHSLDPKNRVFVPARYREQLAAENGRGFMLSLGLDNCLYLFLPSQWDQYVESLRSYRFKNAGQKRAIMRQLFSTAVEAPLDEQGRILIPTSLKEAAGLRKDVTVLGAGARAELWDTRALAKAESSVDKTYRKIAVSLDL